MSEFNEILNKKAVALKYDEAGQKAPVIVAAGKGFMAEKIVETASENGVPVYEDNSLASVLSQLNLGCEIPAEVFKTVVDIYVYFLRYVPKKASEESEKDQEVPGEKFEMAKE